MNAVKLSIITSTFNSAETLPNLLSSIKLAANKVQLDEFEWILVDGNSTDGTVEFIQSERLTIDRFISEKDSGIYEAWNKGLKLVNGQFICFIGSDDTISEDYLYNAMTAIIKYGNTHNVIGFKILGHNYGRDINILHNDNWIKPWNYPINLGFYHCGTLFKKDLFETELFNKRFKLAGDYEHLVRQFKKLYPKIVKTSSPQIYFSKNGTSGKKIKLSYIENIEILWKYRSSHWSTYIRILELFIKLQLRIAKKWLK
jgi:glycosyltransferase involved in cell wall biosynthesis